MADDWRSIGALAAAMVMASSLAPRRAGPRPEGKAKPGKNRDKIKAARRQRRKRK